MRIGKYITNDKCRLCKSKNLKKILDLGYLPLAGDYLLKKDVGKEEFFPTRVYFCQNCYLVQLIDVVSSSKIFKDYRYLSSFSLKEHFELYAKHLTSKYFQKGDFIVEIGSNDGVLLTPLKRKGLRVLGVDPAINVAKIANEKGIETLVDFFDDKVAQRIVRKHGKSDAILANNVLAHCDDMWAVAKGADLLLKDDGVMIFEAHYLLNLIKDTQYDFFYPGEHLTYYSLLPVKIFWEKFGFEIFDVIQTDVHSGSIRVYLKRKHDKRIINTRVIDKFMGQEKKHGLYELSTYKEFEKKVDKHRRVLKNLVEKLSKKGFKVTGYGAAGRGNTLLNVCKLDKSLINCVFDHSPQRYGRFTPGTHIPIMDSKYFTKSRSDYSLILAWSYTNEIIKKEKLYSKSGGRFILPLPRVKII